MTDPDEQFQHSMYDRLIWMLDDHDAAYRIIDHPPEGRTARVSEMRGHALHEAAKCVVLLVKSTKKTKLWVLAVVPGDQRVDFAAVRTLHDARYVGFASQADAQRLAGSVSGTVLPFSFHDDLQLVADPALLDNAHLYFNAARLERSIALDSRDWHRLAHPRLAPIASPDNSTSEKVPT